MTWEKAVPGETSSFPLNKTEDVWQIVPICSMTLTNVTPGSRLCLSWASCVITLAAGENHVKSKEWAQTGTGSWSESCNHVWWLIVGSEKCQREGSHRMGHICLRYSVIRFALAAAVTGFSFHIYDLQVWIMDPLVAILKVLCSLATTWTAGWVPTHAISGRTEATYRA